MTVSLTCRVDAQGRVQLPAELRKMAGIRPNSAVQVSFEDGGLLLLTRERAVRRAQALVRRYIPEGVSLVDELLRDRRREVEREAGEVEEGRRRAGRRKSA